MVTYWVLDDVVLIEIGVCPWQRDSFSIEERFEEFAFFVSRLKALIHSLDLDEQIVGLLLSKVNVNTNSVCWQVPWFEIATVLNNEVIRHVIILVNFLLHKVLQFNLIGGIRAVLVFDLLEENIAFICLTE